MLAQLLNVPESLDSFGTFAFPNSVHHEDVRRYIERIRGIPLPQYNLFPLALEDFGNWLENHQAAHDGINTVLGVLGADLSEINLRDPQAVQIWLRLHFDEHYQWALKTGVG